MFFSLGEPWIYGIQVTCIKAERCVVVYVPI